MDQNISVYAIITTRFDTFSNWAFWCKFKALHGWPVSTIFLFFGALFLKSVLSFGRLTYQMHIGTNHAFCLLLLSCCHQHLAAPSRLRSEVHVSVCFFCMPRMAILFDRKSVSPCRHWNRMPIFDSRCSRPMFTPCVDTWNSQWVDN